MKILCVHNSYQQPGGEDQVFALEAAMLRSHGHRVLVYQASNQQVNGLGRLALLRNTIWHQQVYQQLCRLLQREQPQIVHVHNTFPVISPAVYYAAREQGIPVVQTLHNYRLLCPTATLFRNGRVCEQCVGKEVPWPGVVHGCYRGSRLATAAAAAMLAAHTYKQTWNHTVSAYIALSDFARDKFIQGGLPAAKIFVKPNCLNADPGLGAGRGNYALFVGRLTAEKGISTLLAAWREPGVALPLEIAGDGPMAADVARAVRETPGVSWLKWLPRAQILQKMKDASLLVLPSIWYEGFPMILAEAFAVGLPVVASKLGTMSSIVEHLRTGLHFAPGDSSDLAEKVRWLYEHPAEAARMRVQARLKYERHYTVEQNYAQLIDIYQSLLPEARTQQWIEYDAVHGAD